MRAPLSWLRDFAPIDGDVADLVAALDDLGLMVEGVERVGEGLDRVVVSQGPRGRGDQRGRPDPPGAWSTLAGSQLQIVCGAFNFGAGDLVPLARVGTVLPNGLEIGRPQDEGRRVERDAVLGQPSWGCPTTARACWC